MKLHYGLTENSIILQKEINLDTIKEAEPQEIIYDDSTCKVGVIVNRLTGWNVPEYIVAWFDPESDDITCTYGTTYPIGFDDPQYSPNWFTMEGFSRPTERRTGKVRETYNSLFDKLEKHLETVTAK